MMKLETAHSARIQYRVDAGRTDSEILHLGGLICAKGKGVSAVFLFVRRDLPESFRSKMDWISQQLLVDQVKFFESEVNAVVQLDGVDVLEALADKFAWNLEVTPAEPMRLTPKISAALATVISAKVAEESAPTSSSRKRAATKRSTATVTGQTMIAGAARDLTAIAGAEIGVAEFDECMIYVPDPHVISSQSLSQIDCL